MTYANHSDLSTEAPQGDLFGAPAPTAYAPDPRHVRNRLQALLDEMQASARWPWDPVMVDLHRERSFGYLCGLLPEPEADEWRRRIAAEVARLDGAAEAAV
jgi:hypothetical protein